MMNQSPLSANEVPLDIGCNHYPYFTIKGWIASPSPVEKIYLTDGKTEFPLRRTRRMDVEDAYPSLQEKFGYQGVFKKSEFSDLKNAQLFLVQKDGSKHSLPLAHTQNPETVDEKLENLPDNSVRTKLSYEFLRGEGIELGALHGPTAFHERLARVRYVDRIPVEELRKHYPELHEHDLAPVDIIDDGERLESIPDHSLDFILANHMLEHCEDPLLTLESMLSKLYIRGRLFIALPDKRYNHLDCEREITTFEHVLQDYKKGPEQSRLEHYKDWVRILKIDPALKEQELKRLLDMRYSIHFHIWDSAAALDFFMKARSLFDGAFNIIYFKENHFQKNAENENIFILEKQH